MPKHAARVSSGEGAEASEALRSSDAPKREDRDRDEHIGLTEAFAPVDSSRQVADSEDEEGKIGLTEAFAPVGKGAHAAGFSYKGDAEGEYPDALQSLEPKDAPPLLFGEGEASCEAAPRGAHGKDSVPPHQRKSRRVRRVLIVIIVLLLALILALGYFVVRLVNESQTVAVQQTLERSSSQDAGAIQHKEGKDSTAATEKKTSAPDLTSLLGLDLAGAIEELERGATVTSQREVNEEDNPIKENVTVALTEEPADSRSGTPTVYLGLDEDGAVIQAGYSAATTSLGYGSLSFADAVENERIVEKTLQEAGIDVPEGSAVLPEDKAAYSTYASDGVTVTKENCSFSGAVDVRGVACEWSSVLSYDYATAIMSDNLADTIRIIYVYVSVGA